MLLVNVMPWRRGGGLISGVFMVYRLGLGIPKEYLIFADMPNVFAMLASSPATI